MFLEQYDHEPHIAVLRFWEHAGLHRAEAKRAGGNRALAAIDSHLAAGEFLVGDR